MRHIPEAGDSRGSKNENHHEKDKQDFDECAARFGRSSGGRSSSGSRRRWLRSSLSRGLWARGAGRGGRRWCCGSHRRTGSGRSAPSAESLSIIQRTATVSAKTSHFLLRGSLALGATFGSFDRARTAEHRQARRVVWFGDPVTLGGLRHRGIRNRVMGAFPSEKRHPSSATGRIGARSNYSQRELVCLETIY